MANLEDEADLLAGVEAAIVEVEVEEHLEAAVVLEVEVEAEEVPRTMVGQDLACSQTTWDSSIECSMLDQVNCRLHCLRRIVVEVVEAHRTSFHPVLEADEDEVGELGLDRRLVEGQQEGQVSVHLCRLQRSRACCSLLGLCSSRSCL